MGVRFTRQRQCGVTGRGEGVEVTMISRGVEISIAGGVAETEDDLTICDFFFLFFLFF
jgi:hypothetical protein